MRPPVGLRNQQAAVSPQQIKQRQSVADALMAHMGKRPTSWADLAYNSLSGVGGLLAQRGADKARQAQEEREGANFNLLMSNSGLSPEQASLYEAMAQSPGGREKVMSALMQRDQEANAPITPHQRAQLGQTDRRIGLEEDQFGFDRDYKTNRAGVADMLARGQLGVSQGRLALDRDRLALDREKLTNPAFAPTPKPTEFEKYSAREAAKQIPKTEEDIDSINKTLSAIEKLEGLADDPDTDFGPYSGWGDVGREAANALTFGAAYRESLANNRNFDSTKGDLVLEAMTAIKGAASDRDAALAASVETDRTETRETAQRKLAAKKILTDASRQALTLKKQLIQNNQGPITGEQQQQLNAMMDAAADKAREQLRGGADPKNMSDQELINSLGSLLQQGAAQ